MILFSSLGIKANATALKVSAGPFLKKGIQSSSCLVSKPVDRHFLLSPTEWSVLKVLLKMNYFTTICEKPKSWQVNEIFSRRLSIGCSAKEIVMAE